MRYSMVIRIYLQQHSPSETVVKEGNERCQSKGKSLCVEPKAIIQHIAPDADFYLYFPFLCCYRTSTVLELARLYRFVELSSFFFCSRKKSFFKRIESRVWKSKQQIIENISHNQQPIIVFFLSIDVLKVLFHVRRNSKPLSRNQKIEEIEANKE